MNYVPDDPRIAAMAEAAGVPVADVQRRAEQIAAQKASEIRDAVTFPAERQAPPQISDEMLRAFNDAYWQERQEPGGRLVPVPDRIRAGLAAVYPIIEAEARSRVLAGVEHAYTTQVAGTAATELRDVIAECLYDAANENEDGPGGGLPYWQEFTDGWVMGPVRKSLAAALASREAEVRRQADELEDMQGRLETFQNGYGSLIGSRDRVQAVLNEVLGPRAERKCQSTADDVRLALDTRAAEERRKVAEELRQAAACGSKHGSYVALNYAVDAPEPATEGRV